MFCTISISFHTHKRKMLLMICFRPYNIPFGLHQVHMYLSSYTYYSLTLGIASRSMSKKVKTQAMVGVGIQVLWKTLAKNMHIMHKCQKEVVALVLFFFSCLALLSPPSILICSHFSSFRCCLNYDQPEYFDIQTIPRKRVELEESLHL